MPELEAYLERHKGRTLHNTPDQDLLLLDIARSMRRQTQLAEEGLQFSKGLAKLFETQQ